MPAAADPVKTIKLIAAFSVAFLAALSAQAQVAFQNLNFEQANPGSIVFGPVPVASALPYWSVYYGTLQQTEIEYQQVSTGATSVSLVSVANQVYPPLAGDYSIILTGGLLDNNPQPASISQTGEISSSIQSLFFDAQSQGFPGTLEVQVGTQSIPIVAVGVGSDFTIYGANISAWDGDTEPITFLAPSSESDNFDQWEIDDISFSTTVVSPEPSIVALTAIGGLLFGTRKWFARRC